MTTYRSEEHEIEVTVRAIARQLSSCYERREVLAVFEDATTMEEVIRLVATELAFGPEAREWVANAVKNNS